MGLLAIPIGLLTGFLLAWAGAESTSKGYRRFGIPIILTVMAYVFLKSYWTLTILSLIGVYQIGYGESSRLRRFWREALNEPLNKDKWANIYTRGTLGLLKGLSLLIVPFLTGFWVLWGVSAVFLVLIDVLFGAVIEHEGMVKVFGKDLLLEEVYRGMGIGIITTILTYLAGKKKNE